MDETSKDDVALIIRLFFFFFNRVDYSADGIKSTVAFSHDCHLQFSAKGYIRTPVIKCCQMRFTMQWTARSPSHQNCSVVGIPLMLHTFVNWHDKICRAASARTSQVSSLNSSALPACLHTLQLLGWSSPPAQRLTTRSVQHLRLP